MQNLSPTSAAVENVSVLLGRIPLSEAALLLQRAEYTMPWCDTTTQHKCSDDDDEIAHFTVH